MNHRPEPWRRTAILRFVETYVQQYGHPPTMREIGSGVGGLSTSVVRHHIIRLDQQGVLTFERKVARGIVLNENSDPIYTLAWTVVDAWDEGGMGDAIRGLREHLERFAPRADRT